MGKENIGKTATKIYLLVKKNRGTAVVPGSPK